MKTGLLLVSIFSFAAVPAQASIIYDLAGNAFEQSFSPGDRNESSFARTPTITDLLPVWMERVAFSDSGWSIGDRIETFGSTMDEVLEKFSNFVNKPLTAITNGLFLSDRNAADTLAGVSPGN